MIIFVTLTTVGGFSQRTDYANELINSVECSTTVLYNSEFDTTIILNSDMRSTGSPTHKQHFLLNHESKKLVAFFKILDEQDVFGDIYQSLVLNDKEGRSRSFVNIKTGEKVNREDIVLTISTMFDTECGGEQFYYLVTNKKQALKILEQSATIFDDKNTFKLLSDAIKT